MPRVSKRAKLTLDHEQRQALINLSQSHTAPLREARRAAILLEHADGETISYIKQRLDVSRPTIYKYIDKALAAGIETSIKHKCHKLKARVITEDAKAWVVNLACTKPKEYGYKEELWTLSHLARHARKRAPLAGYSCLKRAAKATIHRILKSHPMQPYNVRAYPEERDEEFTRKVYEVLVVYKKIDYDHKGLESLFLLAALDLQDSHIIAQFHEEHCSPAFVSLLQELDEYYPKSCTIRITLDMHNAHVSKETMRYLATRPNRFFYVHTPKQGSWLDLVETLFSKISSTFLKHIHIESKNELREKILKEIEEMNAEPAVNSWKHELYP